MSYIRFYVQVCIARAEITQSYFKWTRRIKKHSGPLQSNSIRIECSFFSSCLPLPLVACFLTCVFLCSFLLLTCHFAVCWRVSCVRVRFAIQSQTAINTYESVVVSNRASEERGSGSEYALSDFMCNDIRMICASAFSSEHREPERSCQYGAQPVMANWSSISSVCCVRIHMEFRVGMFGCTTS